MRIPAYAPEASMVVTPAHGCQARPYWVGPAAGARRARCQRTRYVLGGGDDMDTETFWYMIETARGRVGETYTVDYDDRMSEALKAQLVELPPDEIMEWDNRLTEVGATAYGPDMEAAAHLISNIFFDGWHGPRFYCFINGLILLGRDAFERAARHPDSLAEHPAIRAVAAGQLPRIAFIAEGIYDIAGVAYCAAYGGTINDYLGKLWGEDDNADQDEDDEDDEDDDEDDEDDDDVRAADESYYDERYDRRWRQRLPHLMKMFHMPGAVAYSSETMKPIKADGSRPKKQRAAAEPRRDDPTGQMGQTGAVFSPVPGQQEDRPRWWQRWRRS
jgi:hypothetical protein